MLAVSRESIPELPGAKCVGHDPEIFFPPPGVAGASHTIYAKAICGGCPARAKCLAEVMKVEEGAASRFGIVAGLDHIERADLANPWGSPSPDVSCGSMAGHYRHLRLRERRCDPCRRAFNADYRARRNARASA